MHAFQFESGVLGLLYLILAVIKGWAFVDAVARPAQAFAAADKLTKPAWLWILGLSLVAHLVWANPLHLCHPASLINLR